MTLVIRCNNGVVVWIVRGDAKRGGFAHCVNSGQEYPLSVSVDATWSIAFRSIIQHSVGLSGAFMDLWVLPTHL